MNKTRLVTDGHFSTKTYPKNTLADDYQFGSSCSK